MDVQARSSLSVEPKNAAATRQKLCGRLDRLALEADRSQSHFRCQYKGFFGRRVPRDPSTTCVGKQENKKDSSVQFEGSRTLLHSESADADQGRIFGIAVERLWSMQHPASPAEVRCPDCAGRSCVESHAAVTSRRSHSEAQAEGGPTFLPVPFWRYEVPGAIAGSGVMTKPCESRYPPPRRNACRPGISGPSMTSMRGGFLEGVFISTS